VIRGAGRTRAALATAFAALLLAGNARASTLDLSWDACDSAVERRGPDGPQPPTLYVTVAGQDAAHKAYFIVIHGYASDGGPPAVPDAWRFDFGGCAGYAAAAIQYPTDASCPPFHGNIASTPTSDLRIQDDGSLVINLIRGYPPGVNPVDPQVRSVVARISFDHSRSVVGPGVPGTSCGGFEREVTWSVIMPAGHVGSAWLDLQGTQHFFEVGRPRATFCGGGCIVPARPETWGAIKATYAR
jgi:hypothetical protein